MRRSRGFGEAMGPWLVLSEHLVPKSPRQKWIETKESWERSRHIEVPAAVPAAPPRPGGLRIAFLIYRGNPRCGGPGRVHPSPDPRTGRARTFGRGVRRGALARARSRSRLHPGRPASTSTVIPTRSACRILGSSRAGRTGSEFGVMCTAGFGEPLAYSRRARQILADRRGDFDVVHDNQCLGTGMLGMVEDGWPLLTTLHHPITVDRQLALSHTTNPWQRFTTKRWFGFLGMQVRVARALPAVLTVSQSSRRDIAAQMQVRPETDDGRSGRGRSHRLPAPRRRDAEARPGHGHLVERRPDEGPGPAARGGGQTTNRTRRAS